MQKKYSATAKLRAWAVHLFTATGAVFAFMALLAVHENDFKMATLWLAVTIFIDGIDGTFARYFKVKEVLPHFDGNSIDHVIDYLTYAIIPAFFFYETNILPEAPALKWLGIIVILLSSTYYYGKTTYVTEDLHFEGFPVLWNLMVFYFYFIFDYSTYINLVLIVIIGVLHFLPWKYPYPSQTREFRWLNILASAICFICVLLAIWQAPDVQSWVVFLAYAVILYFAAMTIYKTFIYKPTRILM